MSLSAEVEEIKKHKISFNTGVEQELRAEIWLIGDQDRHVGRIYFYDSDKSIKPSFVDRGNNPVMHLPSVMLQNVLDILRNEKPVFVHNPGFLSTSKEPVGEKE